MMKLSALLLLEAGQDDLIEALDVDDSAGKKNCGLHPPVVLRTPFPWHRKEKIYCQQRYRGGLNNNVWIVDGPFLKFK